MQWKGERKMKCYDCSHAEMCKWIDEVDGNGCDFEDVSKNVTLEANGNITFKTNNKALTEVAYYASFWNIRHDILLKLAELRDDRIESLTIQEIEDLVMSIPCKGGEE